MNPMLASIERMKHAATIRSAVLALAGLSGPAGSSRGDWGGAVLAGGAPSSVGGWAGGGGPVTRGGGGEWGAPPSGWGWRDGGPSSWGRSWLGCVSLMTYAVSW